MLAKVVYRRLMGSGAESVHAMMVMLMADAVIAAAAKSDNVHELARMLWPYNEKRREWLIDVARAQATAWAHAEKRLP